MVKDLLTAAVEHLKPQNHCSPNHGLPRNCLISSQFAPKILFLLRFLTT